mgnify:CR=1 FL=1
MGTFQAGFDRTVITPPHGTPLRGYFFPRKAEGVLDDLELNTLAVGDGERAFVIIVADLCQIPQPRAGRYVRAVAEKTGLPEAAIYINCTHTHTGPDVGRGAPENPWEEALEHYLVSSAQRALADLSPATLAVGRGRVERVSFIRRYRMKDGYVRTNPGVNNPDILHPIGEPDETEQVLRLVRPGKKEIVLVHFQVHPDGVGGSKVSADYPRFVRETVEQALGGQTLCVYLNGTMGDLNHVNNFPRPGEQNGLEAESFDDCLRGYEYVKNMGRAIAGEALKVYGKTAPVNPLPLRFAEKIIRVPSNRPTPEELGKAQHIAELHNAGRDAELPYKAMELTTAVAEALRMVRLKDGPDEFALNLTALAMGEVAFLGVPGEPFSAIGRAVRERSPFPMTLPSGLTNGDEYYFPMAEAYDEGGYEARSSAYKKGVAEALIEAAIELLNMIHSPI